MNHSKSELIGWIDPNTWRLLVRVVSSVEAQVEDAPVIIDKIRRQAVTEVLGVLDMTGGKKQLKKLSRDLTEQHGTAVCKVCGFDPEVMLEKIKEVEERYL